jgi:hypothetical protein
MRGKRTSTKKRVNMTMKKLNNPDLSTRDVAKELWEAPRTTARIISKELAHVGTLDLANDLYKYNLEIISEWSKKIAQAMKLLNPENIRDTREYQEIVDKSFKQNQLLSWKATENVWVISEITIL